MNIIPTNNGKLEEKKQRKFIESKNENKINPFESKVVLKDAKATIRQAFEIAETQLNKISNQGMNPFVTQDSQDLNSKSRTELKFKNYKRKLATFKNGGSYTYIPKNLRERNINYNYKC